MILSDYIKVVLNPSNIRRFKDLKYDGEINDEIDIRIEDLSNGSHALIDVKCDICGCIKKIKYNQLVKYNYLDHYLCRKCKNEKNLLEKYGVTNVFQIEKIKEKIKKTNIEKYGVDNPSKNVDIKNKKKLTCETHYGTTCPLSSEIIKNKSKNTLLIKYGVDNISKIDEIKRKKENTCIKNNGVKYISQSEDFKKRIKKKVLDFLKNKYGVIDYFDDNYQFYCDKCKSHYYINKRVYQTRREFSVEKCTYCNPIGSFSISGEEKKLMDFIKENYNNEVLENKKIIHPYEIDIYLPDLKLGFEFNGLYWHSELYKENNYHFNKTELAEQQGIKLIQIYEDDWLYKQDIVKSRILNTIGKSEKIMARRCEIREINNIETIRDFLNKNHLQGFVGSQIKIGLFFKEELVSLMTFGGTRAPMNQKKSKKVYEMIRFCNKLNVSVIGGANRLFRYFINNYNPIKIISYADRSWSQGHLYEELGFQLDRKTQPSYFYIINGMRKYRFSYRKDNLIRQGFDPNKTEHEIMLDRNIFRIYDSGHLKYIFELKNPT